MSVKNALRRVRLFYGEFGCACASWHVGPWYDVDAMAEGVQVDFFGDLSGDDCRACDGSDGECSGRLLRCGVGGNEPQGVVGFWEDEVIVVGRIL